MVTTTSFGQGVPAFARMPFNRPRPANPNLLPKLLRTRFATHLHPFEQGVPAAASFSPSLPRASGYMRPGVRPGTPSPVAAAAAPAAPAPGSVAGCYLGAGPYTSMVTGMDVPFRQMPGSIRRGVLQAPTLIQRAHSPGFPFAAVPAGFFRNTAY